MTDGEVCLRIWRHELMSRRHGSVLWRCLLWIDAILYRRLRLLLKWWNYRQWEILLPPPQDAWNYECWEQAADLIEEMKDLRNKALLMLLFKTGIRRNELISLDATNINFENQSITLKPTAKRSNRVDFSMKRQKPIYVDGFAWEKLEIFKKILSYSFRREGA